MAENKTKATPVDVSAFIEGVADETQRADARRIVAMLERVSGEPATMWGPSIIGFGEYHYVYESGREGDMCRIGFSPRKGQTVLYFTGSVDRQPGLLAKLGKHKTGKGCVYIKRLADVDEAVLEELAEASIEYMDDKYPR